MQRAGPVLVSSQKAGFYDSVIQHTFCSSACVLLSLQDGGRALYKEHHRSACPQEGLITSDCVSQHLFFLYYRTCW